MLPLKTILCYSHVVYKLRELKTDLLHGQMLHIHGQWKTVSGFEVHVSLVYGDTPQPGPSLSLHSTEILI